MLSSVSGGSLGKWRILLRFILQTDSWHLLIVGAVGCGGGGVPPYWHDCWQLCSSFADLNALPPSISQHSPSLKPPKDDKAGALLRDVEVFPGRLYTCSTFEMTVKKGGGCLERI